MYKENPPEEDLLQTVCGAAAIAFWIFIFLFPPLAGICALVVLVTGGLIVGKAYDQYVKERDKQDKDN